IVPKQIDVPTTRLELKGDLSFTAGGKFVSKILDHLHVKFGNATTYVVTADLKGTVNLVSKSGDGIWGEIDPDTGTANMTIGSVQVHWVSGSFRWDQTKKEFSLAGQWEVSFKDDDPNKTKPFLVQLGDQASPGLTLSFQNGVSIKHFQATLIAGMNDGKHRTGFNIAGAQVDVSGFFFVYDQATDAIGIGGIAKISYGSKDAQDV